MPGVEARRRFPGGSLLGPITGLSGHGAMLAPARTAGLGRRRVDEVLELAGLAEVADMRAGGFSLGMGQRLGVAAALLGQPQTAAWREHVPIFELTPARASLEEAFMQVTQDSIEYHAGATR